MKNGRPAAGTVPADGAASLPASSQAVASAAFARMAAAT